MILINPETVPTADCPFVIDRTAGIFSPALSAIHGELVRSLPANELEYSGIRFGFGSVRTCRELKQISPLVRDGPTRTTLARASPCLPIIP